MRSFSSTLLTKWDTTQFNIPTPQCLPTWPQRRPSPQRYQCECHSPRTSQHVEHLVLYQSALLAHILSARSGSPLDFRNIDGAYAALRELLIFRVRVRLWLGSASQPSNPLTVTKLAQTPKFILPLISVDRSGILPMPTVLARSHRLGHIKAIGKQSLHPTLQSPFASHPSSPTHFSFYCLCRLDHPVIIHHPPSSLSFVPLTFALAFLSSLLLPPIVFNFLCLYTSSVTCLHPATC